MVNVISKPLIDFMKEEDKIHVLLNGFQTIETDAMKIWTDRLTEMANKMVYSIDKMYY